MKLRYYLRGLGVGILVTTIFFLVSNGDSGTMTDEEIKARALELGMVENTALTLADIKEKQEAAPESVAPESIAVIESSESKTENETTESKPPAPVSESTGEPQQAASTENVEGQDHITVTIERGQSSYGVSLMLEELGLVADAEEFDDYLCDMGYSKHVRYGVYHIAVGISEEELADIISGK